MVKTWGGGIKDMLSPSCENMGGYIPHPRDLRPCCSVSQFVKICLISCFEFLSMSCSCFQFNYIQVVPVFFCIQFVSLSNSNLCGMFSSSLCLPFIILFMKLVLHAFIILFFISDHYTFFHKR